MVFGLIGAGLGIAQSVMGIVGAAKGAKGDKAEGGGDAKAPKNAAEKKGNVNKEETIDRFLKLLDNPNVRTLADIKGVRDRVMAAIQEKGLDPQAAENAKKKLNHAILKKLGIGKPGANGSLEVNMTPQVQQILAQLGMPPDQVKAAPAGPVGAPAPAGVPGMNPGVPAPVLR